jgi:hypothetical protein
MNEWDATAVFSVLEQLLWLRAQPNWSNFYSAAASYAFDAAKVTIHWSKLKAGDVMPTSCRQLRNTVSHDQFMKVPLDLFDHGLRCIAHGYSHLTPADPVGAAAALTTLTTNASMLPAHEVREELTQLFRAIDLENRCRLAEGLATLHTDAKDGSLRITTDLAQQHNEYKTMLTEFKQQHADAVANIQTQLAQLNQAQQQAHAAAEEVKGRQADLNADLLRLRTGVLELNDFVVTQQAGSALAVLRQQHVLMVEGEPGVGKSAEQGYLVRTLAAETGLRIIADTLEPADMLREHREFGPAIFLFDDVFGKTYVNHAATMKWAGTGPFLAGMLSTSYVCFIFTQLHFEGRIINARGSTGRSRRRVIASNWWSTAPRRRSEVR